MQVNLPDKASSSYEPTQIPKEKYSKIVEGRNRFFLFSIGAVTMFMAASSTPQFLINRLVRRVYHRYCRGKVLDLSPKLYDEHDVALYELSRAVRVEYLVEKKVVDDGRYRIEDLPEHASEERRRAMTLDYMVRNDHHWVGSPVTFTVVERGETTSPCFIKYDSIIIREELMNRKDHSARELFDSAAPLLDAEGHFLVMDFGKSSNRHFDGLVRWFNEKTKSSMCLSHDYNTWVKENMVYEVVEERRALFGFYYALVLRKRKP